MTFEAVKYWLFTWAGLTADVVVACFIAGFFTEAYRQHCKKRHDDFMARIRSAPDREVIHAYCNGLIDYDEYCAELDRRHVDKPTRNDGRSVFYADNVAYLTLPNPYGIEERR